MSDEIGDATGAKGFEHVCFTCAHLGRAALMGHRSSLPRLPCQKLLPAAPEGPPSSSASPRGAAEGCSEAPGVNKGKRARGGVAPSQNYKGELGQCPVTSLHLVVTNG